KGDLRPGHVGQRGERPCRGKKAPFASEQPTPSFDLLSGKIARGSHRSDLGLTWSHLRPPRGDQPIISASKGRRRRTLYHCAPRRPWGDTAARPRTEKMQKVAGIGRAGRNQNPSSQLPQRRDSAAPQAPGARPGEGLHGRLVEREALRRREPAPGRDPVLLAL